ncbi:MAG: hypothetical protein JXX29_14490 [Deltaproteobacteria bacterium]|nr:hypothetical protein [Deltaproteobacteria bacterium]MBN2672888.1 hypothetical protein [Deltaproteobacteria bacterium]
MKKGFQFQIVLCLLIISVLSAGCRKDYLSTIVQANRVNQFAILAGQKIAVLPLAGNKGHAAADLLTIEFLRRGVQVVERSTLDNILAEVRRTENGYYNNDLSDLEVLQQIGRITEVDYIVYGEIEGYDPDTIRLMRSDFGSRSPWFYFAYARMSLRIFSVSTGEVFWWGSSESATRAAKGDYVRLMDHLRMTARLAAESMMNVNFNTHNARYKNRNIPPFTAGTATLVPNSPVGAAPAAPPIAPAPASLPSPPLTAPAAEIPPASPPASPAVSTDTSAAPIAPAPAVGTPAQPAARAPSCSRDIDCPGDLICNGGACIAQ